MSDKEVGSGREGRSMYKGAEHDQEKNRGNNGVMGMTLTEGGEVGLNILWFCFIFFLELHLGGDPL